MSHYVYCLMVCCLLALLPLPVAAQQIVGMVTDARTGEGVPCATLYYRGLRLGAMADTEGRFAVPCHSGSTLHVSALGYRERLIEVTAATPDTLRIALDEDVAQLSEVVIKARRQRYSRKNNKAVELMRRVVAARELARLDRHDYYQYHKYQKLSLALNDYHAATPDSLQPRRKRWSAQAEVSPYNHKVVLPISVDETVKQHVYRRQPRAERDIVHGTQTTGINQLLVTGDILSTMLKDVFQDVNIYDDYVRLLQYPFVSPIGSHAVGFYRYYIEDTVCVDRQPCYHLRFFPNNQHDFGFTGHLYILADSTLRVKRCSLALPPKSSVNFVDRMHVEQTFGEIDGGEWALTADDMWAEMTVVGKPLLVVRNTRLSGYAFDELPKSLFYGKARERTVANARNRDDGFWQRYRAVALTDKEQTVGSFMERLKRQRGMQVPLFLARCIVENYIETGTADRPSKFDFGPMLSTFSSNHVDGFRARISGRTMGALHPRWFWKGYYAHGFGSGHHYYGSTVTYSLNPKQHSPFEFPQRNLSIETTRDVMNPADQFLYNDKDNVLMGIRTERVDQLYFYNRQQLTMTYETEDGLALSAAIKAESLRAAGRMRFTRMADGNPASRVRTTTCSVGIVYTPGQTYVNTKQRRYPVSFDSPEFHLRHTMGIKGLLGGQYRSQLTELGIYRRQWLGSWGNVDMYLHAAAQWERLPFPLLLMPPTDLSYIEQKGTFNMLHNMEFFMDRQLFWSLSWDLNGKLLHRLPLVRDLKLREYVAIKGVWGKLTEKNNPTLPQRSADATLFELPQGSYAITSTRPYMEIVVGIHNIFRFFALDWVHRLSYNDHPDTRKNGVRFGLIMTF